MAWSYDPTDLDDTTEEGRKNIVRLLIGDTNTLDQQVQDEEIFYALSETNDNTYAAAAYISRTIAAQYARRVNTELDGALKAEYSDLMKNYMALSRDLEAQGRRRGGNMGISAGGISRTTVGANRANTNRVKPVFTKDQFKNPPNQDGLGQGNVE
jgi:hypothetical protein